MGEYFVATVDEIPVGQRKIVQVKGRSIGIFNIDGEFYALRNVCPHQGAPLCMGSIGGMTVCEDSLDDVKFIRNGEILRCPWHGWEFDIKTGKSIFDPGGYLVKTYDVTIEKTGLAEIQGQVEKFPVTIQDDCVVIHL